ncbi:MAG: hypothetical protein ABSB96_03125 [Gaiellaceae bacterium]
MTKRRLGTIVLLALGAVLVLSSCGGGGSKRVTKEQFAAKANALCAAFNKQVNAVGNPTTIQEMIAMVNKLLPLDRKLVADFEKLKPPSNEEATVKRLVQLGNEQAARIEAMLAALKKSDMATVNTLTKGGDANDKESKTLFRQIGATECNKS